MISSSKKDYIIEYRPTCIRVVRVSSYTSPIAIESIEEIPLGNDVRVIAAAVRKLAGVKANGYLSGACVVYPERRVIRQITIDAPKGTEADFVFKTLGESFSDVPVELSVHCLSPATGEEIDPSNCNNKEVIVCGVPNVDIVNLQNQMLEHGIYPNRIELGTIGTIGSLQDALIQEGSEAPSLFLEIEKTFSNTVIVGPKGIEMSRRIETGSEDIAFALKGELNLKDENAAYKLLSSRDFDFSSISRKILRRLMRELQSSIGFYEVQTGQSVSWIHCSNRVTSMDWLEGSVGSLLNLNPFSLDLSEWLKANDIKGADDSLIERLDISWLGQLASLCNFKKEEVAA
jgi:hypothetical protein